MANITAALFIDELDKVDELVEEGKATSRSEIIREALGNYLKDLERDHSQVRT